MPSHDEYIRNRRNSLNRSRRLMEARKKGTHTKQQWLDMKCFFNNTCCKCFGETGLKNVEKDHIIPLYKEGSDGIDNIQPMCALCNIRKGSETIDWRPKLAEFLKKELPIEYNLIINIYG